MHARLIRIPAGVSGGVRHRQVGHLAPPRQLDTRALRRWRHVLAVAVLRHKRRGVLGKVYLIDVNTRIRLRNVVITTAELRFEKFLQVRNRATRGQSIVPE